MFIMLPKIDPLIKLVPMIKLIGSFTVSSQRRLTLLFLKLFWMPIINIKNKQELNEITKSNFLKGTIISFDFNLDYKVCFFLNHVFSLNI